MEDLNQNANEGAASDSEYDKNSLADKFLLMKGISPGEEDWRRILAERLEVDNLILLIKTAFEHIQGSVNKPVDRVLDIGCGDGFAGRALVDKKLAQFIVGIDISQEMIRRAEIHCDNDINHYQYIVRNASNLNGLGQFPLIIQNYMLCEIESVDELLKVLCSVRLACSGAFVGLIPSPFFNLKSVHKLQKYKMKYESRQAFDGDKCYITFECGTPNEFTIVDYWYKAETYENLFKAAGFNYFEWLPCQINANATRAEKEFIQDLIDSGKYIGFIALI